MRYNKLTYDFGGSSYQPKKISVPTDSIFAIGIVAKDNGKRIDGQAVNLVNGYERIEPEQTLNQIAMFQFQSDSESGKSVNWKVKIHKESKKGEQLQEGLSSTSTFAKRVYFEKDFIETFKQGFGDENDIDLNELKFAMSNLATTEDELVLYKFQSVFFYTTHQASNRSSVEFNGVGTQYGAFNIEIGGVKYQSAKSESGKCGFVPMLEVGDERIGTKIEDDEIVQLKSREVSSLVVTYCPGMMKKTDGVKMAKGVLQIGEDIDRTIGTLDMTQVEMGFGEC